MKKIWQKKVLILYEVNKKVQKLEIIFKRNNFLHLTGLKITNVKLNSNAFYKKVLNQRISLNDFEINSDGTTKLKIISSLRENIKNITERQYRIMCIATKELQNKNYENITYMSKENVRYNTLEKINKSY